MIRVDRAIAQQTVELGAAERAVGVAGYKNLAVEWFETLHKRRHPRSRASALPAFMRLGEQAAVARKIGIVRSKDDVHMRDRPAGAARRFKRAPTCFEKPRGRARAALKRKRNQAARMADVVLKMQRDQRVAAMVSRLLRRRSCLLRCRSS